MDVSRKTLDKRLAEGRRLGRSFLVGVIVFVLVYATLVLLGTSERVGTIAAFALLVPSLIISQLFRISFHGTEFMRSLRQAISGVLSIRSVWDDDTPGRGDRTRERKGHT